MKHTECPRCNTPRVIFGEENVAEVMPGYQEQLHCSYGEVQRFVIPSIFCMDRNEQYRLIAEAKEKAKKDAEEKAGKPCPRCGEPLVAYHGTDGSKVFCLTGSSQFTPKTGPYGTRYIFRPLPGCSECCETHTY